MAKSQMLHIFCWCQCEIPIFYGEVLCFAGSIPSIGLLNPHELPLASHLPGLPVDTRAQSSRPRRLAVALAWPSGNGKPINMSWGNHLEIGEHGGFRCVMVRIYIYIFSLSAQCRRSRSGSAQWIHVQISRRGQCGSPNHGPSYAVLVEGMVRAPESHCLYLV